MDFQLTAVDISFYFFFHGITCWSISCFNHYQRQAISTLNYFILPFLALHDLFFPGGAGIVFLGLEFPELFVS